MVLIGEKFVAVNKNAAGAGFEIARIAFESAERLTRLNLEAAKMLLQESAASARTLATGKDFGAFNAWRDAQAQGAQTGFWGTRATSTRLPPRSVPTSVNCWNRDCYSLIRESWNGLRKR